MAKKEEAQDADTPQPDAVDLPADETDDAVAQQPEPERGAGARAKTTTRLRQSPKSSAKNGLTPRQRKNLGYDGLIVGALVHFHFAVQQDVDGAQATVECDLAAVVTWLYGEAEDQPALVDLNVHFPADQTKYPPVVAFAKVVYDPHGGLRSWHWPERS